MLILGVLLNKSLSRVIALVPPKPSEDSELTSIKPDVLLIVPSTSSKVLPTVKFPLVRVNILETVVFSRRVTPNVLLMVKLLKVEGTVPKIVCAEAPFIVIVPPEVAINDPLFSKLPPIK